eukprot:jgi/Pico_ML_1/52437/g3141.t1
MRRISFSKATAVQWRKEKKSFVAGNRRKVGGRVVAKAERNPAQDALQAWLDVSAIVSTPTQQDEARDELASQIGKEIYLDINGWHLYLRDVSVAGTKLHVALSALIADRVSAGLDVEEAVQCVVDKVPIKIGGKKQLPLSQFLPVGAVQDMNDVVKEYLRNR